MRLSRQHDRVVVHHQRAIGGNGFDDPGVRRSAPSARCRSRTRALIAHVDAVAVLDDDRAVACREEARDRRHGQGATSSAIGTASTPARANASRSDAARLTAPGVSPCRQIVSAWSSRSSPVTAVTLAFDDQPEAPLDNGRLVVDDGAGHGPRHQRATGVERAVREHLARHAQPHPARHRLPRRAGQHDEDETAVDREDGIADGAGDVLALDGHVVEGAVGLHVLEALPAA